MKSKFIRTVTKIYRHGEQYGLLSIPKPIFDIYDENNLLEMLVEYDRNTKKITVTPIIEG
jgi:hypothetical protein